MTRATGNILIAVFFFMYRLGDILQNVIGMARRCKARISSDAFVGVAISALCVPSMGTL